MRMKGDVAAAQVRETGVDDFNDTDHGMYTQPITSAPYAASYQPAIYYTYIQFRMFIWIIHSIPGVRGHWNLPTIIPKADMGTYLEYKINCMEGLL